MGIVHLLTRVSKYACSTKDGFEEHYDVDEGEVLLDGVNLKDYNIPFLRSVFGLVQQEPVLFNDTIAENIRVGRADVIGDIIERDYENKDPMIHEIQSEDTKKTVEDQRNEIKKELTFFCLKFVGQFCPFPVFL